jgi:putative oligomerization/nucleic acid binding protein
MGLVRGMARTAVVAGTATAVSNRVSRRQASRWASQDMQQQGYAEPSYQQQPPPPPPAPAPAPADDGDDLTSQLQRLGDLHQQGILSDEEFAAAKSRLITG